MSWNLSTPPQTGLVSLLFVLMLGCTGGDGDRDEEVVADAGSPRSADGSPSCSGTDCEPCPAHSARPEGGDACVCDEGFSFDESGELCEADDTCPANSSPFEENGQSGCRCDEGYVANPAGNACVLPADACPAHSSYFEENGQSGCRCDEGYVVNGAGDACVLPEECPAGNPKATVNGVVVLCCPANAEGVQLSQGVWSCTCAEGASYDADLNQCL